MSPRVASLSNWRSSIATAFAMPEAWRATCLRKREARPSADAEGAEIYAETVSNGDPTFAGPLAGASLGLAVYHVFDPEIRAEIDDAVWEEQVSMMEMVLDPEALAAAVKSMREQYSQFKL